MKRALLGLLCCCSLVVGSVPAAMAGVDNDAASISTHIGPSFFAKVCANKPALNRYNIVTRVDVGVNCLDGDWNIWVFVCNGSDSLGIAGMEFGIDYDGVGGSGIDINGWTMCANLQFPSSAATPPIWPQDGSGNVITWNAGTNCQNVNSEPFVAGSVIAMGGVFNVSVYSPDQLSITPRYTSVQDRAKIADCSASETDITGLVPSHLGVSGYCMPGYNPCFSPTPVEVTTWGRLKGQFN